MKMVTLLLLSCVAIVDAAYSLDETECIEWHNKYRKLHQAPNISWSSSLARDAQNWAEHLAAARLVYHDPNRQSQGENLYQSSGDSKHSCQKATTAFYNEVKDYDYDNPGFSKKTGHFTQVVWIKSTQLGVGKAETSTGGTVLVFRYSPPGNYKNQYEENVKPPIGFATSLRHSTSFLKILALGVVSFVVTAHSLI